MSVSENRGFSPQIIYFNKVFHYKPSILGKHPYFWKTPMTSFWWIFTWKLVVTSELSCCLWRQQVGAGRGSYEVVAGAQGKGGQNMAIWRRVPGQNSTKNDFKVGKSIWKKSHRICCPWFVSTLCSLKCFSMKIGWYLNPATCASCASWWRWARNVATFETWCNNESGMKRKVNADGNESFTKICVCGTCPMELGCCHDRSWIDQLEDALLWPRVLQLQRYHARLRREESMCVIYSFVLYLIWARESSPWNRENVC